MHLKLGFISTIVISSAEAAREIMKTHDNIFSTRPKLVAPKILGYNYSDIAFAPYGSYWRQLKKISTLEFLTAKRLESTRFIREEEVKLFLQSISKSSGPIHLAERLFALNHNVIARIIFGDQVDDQLRLQIAIREGTALAGGFQIGDFFPSLGFIAKLTGMNKRLEECFGELNVILDKTIQNHIDQRKLEKPQRECFIDVLLRLQEDGDLETPLTTDNIKSVLLDMFTGATENSSNTVEWAMTELLRHPDMMKKAQTEIRQVISEKANPKLEETDLPRLNYLKMVVKETLRFHTPLPLLLPRESMERCVINGYEIPSHTRVLINYWAIAHDPTKWKDANMFNPERFQNDPRDYRGHDFDFIPFGAGRRVCPGISLGVVNAELSLASLLYHFDWKLADGEKPQDLDMNETFGMTKQNLLLPPGPPKLPLIGDMHRLLHPSPHRALNDLAAKYGPIMHLRLGFIPTIIISSAEAARQIMKTHDNVFSNRPKLMAPKILGYNYSDIAFAPYGPYWRQVKKMCILELSTSKSMDSTRFIREEEVKLLVESISKSLEPINLVERLFALNHNIIARVTFDEKFDDELRFRSAIREGTALAAGFQIGDFFPSLGFVAKLTGMNRRLEECLVELSSIMDKKIQDRIDLCKVKRPRRECLVDALLRLQDKDELDQPLTIDNIKSVLLDVFTGASENSSNIVEWAMTEMLRNPSMMKKAQNEIRRVISEKPNPSVEETDLPKLNYMKMVVKETLRFHPPVPLLLPRESMERCMINGYEIPSQTRVLINYWAIARDPSSWKDPDVFNPERFQDEAKDYRGHDFEYIPFGGGRRVCPGISLGMANTELSLTSLLYHFDWKLADGENPQNLDMNETFGMTCYKTCSLRLVPSLRFPVST
ncbi:hypothetical protein M8C21_006863 [Ambrosia artemisiifolia]|uniref:Cytochrome P450 n=1 Tax=Ambrosia artemisiifolia TaxID=4212 RepID=A0AAD5CC25_AMBAR|nr:hypothetical protein M8C21_006863 [Ambrosia artemisiifolia]